MIDWIRGLFRWCKHEYAPVSEHEIWSGKPYMFGASRNIHEHPEDWTHVGFLYVQRCVICNKIRNIKVKI